MDYSWTGDPATDQILMQNLLAQQGQSYYRQKNRLSEELNARGFGGGGVGLGNLDSLMAQQGADEGNLRLGAAQAYTGRLQQQRQQEQEVQNQMRVMNYQAQLQKKRKMSAMQRALLYGGSGAGLGAEVGSAIEPGVGTAVGAGAGALAGGLYGYFGNE